MLVDINIAYDELTSYLKQKNIFLEEDEYVENIEIAGEGNMNVVLRVFSNKNTFILKQSRTFVRKYPNIQAPLERINVEYNFYKHVSKNSFLPKLKGYIQDDYILILEDLGKGEDMTFIYDNRDISKNVIKDFILALSDIHIQNFDKGFPENKELRKLNHQHIFVLPFLENNGFSLNKVQDGLEDLAKPFKQNKKLIKKLKYLGNNYMSKGDTLVHGDYYPGSWLYANEKRFIIDPEFSFIGPKEFDLGVMAAHLVLTTGNKTAIDYIFEYYPNSFNRDLMSQYCGAEMIRRIIGIAQLPMKREINEKKELLHLALKFILD